jgi:hypothetical protein
MRRAVFQHEPWHDALHHQTLIGSPGPRGFRHTGKAESHVDRLIAHDEAKARLELERAKSWITRTPDAGLAARRLYPTLKQPGRRRIKTVPTGRFVATKSGIAPRSRGRRVTAMRDTRWVGSREA